jgi:hypothetical protein
MVRTGGDPRALVGGRLDGQSGRTKALLAARGMRSLVAAYYVSARGKGLRSGQVGRPRRRRLSQGTIRSFFEVFGVLSLSNMFASGGFWLIGLAWYMDRRLLLLPLSARRRWQRRASAGAIPASSNRHRFRGALFPNHWPS